MSLNIADVSPALVSLKPNLILCKCVGVCSLSNLFGSSHTGLLKVNFFSIQTIYQLLYILYFQSYHSESFGSLLYFQRKAHFVTLLSFFDLVMFVECMFSDRKLLKLLESIDKVDAFVKNTMPFHYRSLVNLDVYKWLVGIFMIEVLKFFDRNCHWDIAYCLNTNSLHTILYRHIPYLSVISLFCTMSDQLIKRFHLVRIMMIENQERLDQPLFIEECRHLYGLIAVSTEIFLDWISIRLTNYLILITLYSVCNVGFPCFYGEGCLLTVLAFRVLQQMIMVYIMCYCASKLNKKSEEILNELLMTPLGKAPYNCKDQIEVFIDQIIARPLKVSAFGLFEVDMTTLLSVFSVILMYTVVVAQLSDRLQGYFVLH